MYVPLAAEVQRVVGWPARGVEAATAGGVVTATGNTTRSSIAVEGISLITVATIRSINIDTELLTVMCAQGTLIYICRNQRSATVAL